MDTNNMMTTDMFTMNDEHTQSENVRNILLIMILANHASNILESLINLTVSVAIILVTFKSK